MKRVQIKSATAKSVSVKQLKKLIFAPALDIPLMLSDMHNGSKRVQGSIGCRLIYHTRGKVLRGVDVGVQQMSLGERARLSIRSDYAFDVVRPGPRVPEGSELEIIADLVYVAGHSSWIIYLQRAINGRYRIFENKLVVVGEKLEGKFPRMANCFATMTKLLYWCYATILTLLCFTLFCFCKACMKIGEKKRVERRERRRREREAAILAYVPGVGIFSAHLKSGGYTHSQTCGVWNYSTSRRFR